MQPLFSNARSKAAKNHIKLSDTRRATLAWLALLIMRARHDLLVAARAEFRQFRDAGEPRTTRIAAGAKRASLPSTLPSSAPARRRQNVAQAGLGKAAVN